MFFLNVSVDVCRFFKLLCSFFLSCWWAIAIVRFLVKFFCITYYLSIFHFYPTLIFPRHGNKVLTCIIFRVGNLLISFLSESIVFCKKWANNEQMSDLLKKTSDSLLCSFFGEWPEQITHGHSFLVSKLSDLLTSLIKKEGRNKSLIFLKTL